ncbi:MAG: hypothetical protein HY075_07805 [Deltaproteobacteria bacterium]|nr:hypothetical protein [Deltaproteobacteria bacterium]
MLKKTMKLVALLSMLAVPSASADSLELFGRLDPRNDVQMAGMMGVEVNGQFPENTFLVGVEIRGFSSSDRRTRYFWVSGSATFNEGVVYENPDHKPDVLFFDVNVVPVVGWIRENYFHDGHTASATKIAPLEFSRDLRLGKLADIAVRAYGVAFDGSRDVKAISPALQGFVQVAVDAVGFHYLSQATYAQNPLYPSPAEYRYGVDFGTVRAKTGVQWDANKTFGIRLTLGGTATFSALSSPVREKWGGVAQYEAYSRLEFLFTHIFTRWSIFTQAGLRGSVEDEEEFTRNYGYVQIGLMGSYY